MANRSDITVQASGSTCQRKGSMTSYEIQTQRLKSAQACLLFLVPRKSKY